MIEYIRQKQIKRQGIYGVPIEIKEKINFDLDRVIKQIKKIVPKKAFDGLKKIIITDMSKVGKDLPFNAYYINNIMFVDNKQDGTVDAVDDIVHEISHHIEKKYSDLIYGDKNLESEFITKRKFLYDILAANNMSPPNLMRTTTKYDKRLDDYLYNKIGAKLNNFVNGLFINEYAATSLREYYGVGFEKYIMSYNNHKTIKRQSPVLFYKLEQLVKELNEQKD
tara:strand:+ start:66 stop:734 length:669 start_codon:yes stop_codon:yes gene_type:complete